MANNQIRLRNEKGSERRIGHCLNYLLYDHQLADVNFALMASKRLSES